MKPQGLPLKTKTDYDGWFQASRGRETNRVRKLLAEEVAHCEPEYVRFTEYAYHDRALISEHVIEASVAGDCPCCRMAPDPSR